MQSEQQQRIMGYFIEEAKDHLSTIEQGLLNLQGTIEDPDLVNEVFRAAHSVKGGAAMLGLDSIQQTAHRLEDYFKVLKECPLKIDQKLESLFLRVFDTLQDLLEQLQGPYGLTTDAAAQIMGDVEPVLAQLNSHLGQLVEAAGHTPPDEVDLTHTVAAPVAEPAPTPVSASTSTKSEDGALRLYFQSDVPAQLRTMLGLFKQPDTGAVRQQLQDICTAFAQAGESFDLPQNWSHLAILAQRAIASPDNDFRHLAPALIKDFKQAQDLVLAGKADEITPSPALQDMQPLTDVTDEELPVLTSEDLLGDMTDFLDIDSEASISDDDLFDDDALSSLGELEQDNGSSDADFTEDDLFGASLGELDLDSSDLEGDLDLDHLGTPKVDEPAKEISAPATPSAIKQGPQVGTAELNSLADLFENEAPELGMDWHEEIIDDASDLMVDGLALDASNDFSDLLFDEGTSPASPEHEHRADDISGIMAGIDELSASPSSSSSASDDEFSDLFSIGTSEDTGSAAESTHTPESLPDEIDDLSNFFDASDDSPAEADHSEDFSDSNDLSFLEGLSDDASDAGDDHANEFLALTDEDAAGADLLAELSADSGDASDIDDLLASVDNDSFSDSLDTDASDGSADFELEDLWDSTSDSGDEQEDSGTSDALDFASFSEIDNLAETDEVAETELSGMELPETDIFESEISESYESLDLDESADESSEDLDQLLADEFSEELLSDQEASDQEVEEASSELDASFLDTSFTDTSFTEGLDGMLDESSQGEEAIDDSSSDTLNADLELDFGDAFDGMGEAVDGDLPDSLDHMLDGAEDSSGGSDSLFGDRPENKTAEPGHAEPDPDEVGDFASQALESSSDDLDFFNSNNTSSDGLGLDNLGLDDLGSDEQDSADLLSDDVDNFWDSDDTSDDVTDIDALFGSDDAYDGITFDDFDSSDDVGSDIMQDLPDGLLDELSDEFDSSPSEEQPLVYETEAVVSASDQAEHQFNDFDAQSSIGDEDSSDHASDYSDDPDINNAFDELEGLEFDDLPDFESVPSEGDGFDELNELEGLDFGLGENVTASDQTDSADNLDADEALDGIESEFDFELESEPAESLSGTEYLSEDAEEESHEDSSLDMFGSMPAASSAGFESEAMPSGESASVNFEMAEDVGVQLDDSELDDSELEDFSFDMDESAENSITSGFDDLDALLDDDADLDGGLDSLTQDDESFDELDNLLSDVDSEPSAPEEGEFDDLDALLSDSLGQVSATSDADETQLSDISALSDDNFDDLEALLDTPSELHIGVANHSDPIDSSDGSDDSDFSDLEKLLEDADQTLVAPPSAKTSRGGSPIPNRRPVRRGSGGFSEQTMRVAVKNLDNLNNLVGELVVNRNSLEQSQERLRQFLDNLLYQVQQLSDVGQRMRDLYERSLLESSLLSSRRSYQLANQSGGEFIESAEATHATGASFDALEMDRFTGFHTLSQEMIELIVRVREAASDIDFVIDESDQTTRMFRQVTTQLQEGLTRSRMVPFAQAASRLPRAVRDISIKCGKQAELEVEGKDTLIDKMILEQLYDPMTHLVNNAITHGIETPEERHALNKPPVGKITIRVFHQGNQTIISVTDDGAGIDPDNVKAKALQRGLISPEEAVEMTRLDIYDLLFHHGFSTRDQADDFAGRGVGMDVVRTSLSEIRGVINIDSTVGQGTTFTIRLPLTLSISKALLCVSNRARIAFPMDGVEDMLDVPSDRIQNNEEGKPCIYWRDIVLPFYPLSELLKYNRMLGRGSVYGGNQEEDVVSVVVLRSAGNYLALQVDQVLGEQEIVIKQLEAPIPKPAGIAGATVLGDGRIMPIADVLELIDLSMGRIRKEVGSSLWEQEAARIATVDTVEVKSEPTVLIVDDSITVRELLSMTFNKVGYRVEQARDGQEAWEKLKSGLPCELVFCDIEMPRMDGLELLSRLQKDPNLKNLPIAMLTSRGADRHRQMAVQLGAKGYFTKPYLEEVLLDAAQRMLNGEVLIGNA
ncbi:MAG: response regulator [Leptolyngbyaceae bacterium]|nr:response regulator [Leptolyngbyaceae bacterium]